MIMTRRHDYNAAETVLGPSHAGVARAVHPSHPIRVIPSESSQSRGTRQTPQLGPGAQRSGPGPLPRAHGAGAAGRDSGGPRP